MPAAAPALVLIDRDGVINRDSDAYIKSADEWEPLPGSLEALAKLTAAGYMLAVVTNQSGIGRGLFDAATLEAIHAKMRAVVADAGGRIDAVFHCPHLPDAGCDCRKPQPGLLIQAADHFGVGLTGVPFIGDKQSDVDAALAAGARPVLVGSRVAGTLPGVERYADLAEAVAAIIAGRSKTE